MAEAELAVTELAARRGRWLTRSWRRAGRAGGIGAGGGEAVAEPELAERGGGAVAEADLAEAAEAALVAGFSDAGGAGTGATRRQHWHAEGPLQATCAWLVGSESAG